MLFSIERFEVYGLKTTYAFLDGWVDTNAVKLVISNGKKDCLIYEFNTDTKLHAHYLNIELPIEIESMYETFIAYFEDRDGNRIKAATYTSTIVDRMLKRKREIDEDKFLKESRNEFGYQKWIETKECFSPVEDYTYNPLISIIIPVYNVSRKYLSLCLDSILNQTYQNFEICLADDCSPSKETRDTLKEYEQKDKRIKVLYRKENGHISNASNSALSLATGEFIAMMDNDDELMPQALNEIVRVLNQDPTLDFIYTDEDKEDLDGNRSDPQFKPDLAIEKLYGGNYICHFNVVRKSIMDEIGGFRVGYEGAQDFDLFLRILEKTKKFYHIPKVLYHWRMIPGSTALSLGSKNYAGEAGKRALIDHLKKNEVEAQVNIRLGTNYTVTYIPKKLDVDVLLLCDETTNIEEKIKEILDLHYDKTIQFTIIGNVEELNIENVRYLKENKSKYDLINQAIQTSKKVYIAILNANVKLLTYDSLFLLQGYCENKEIGVVGGRVIDEKKNVIESGYVLTDKKLLSNCKLIKDKYFTVRDYGNYSNHLVANNFRILEREFIMIRKDILNEVNGFNVESTNPEFELCLKIDRAGYRNVVEPRILIQTNSSQPIQSIDFKKWQQEGLDVDYDHYYNECLSKTVAFAID